jgi:hypothetical protein
MAKPNTGSITKFAPHQPKSIEIFIGDPSTLSAGWYLCDGGTYNGIVTPNLEGTFPQGNSGDPWVKLAVASKTALPNIGISVVEDSHTHTLANKPSIGLANASGAHDHEVGHSYHYSGIYKYSEGIHGVTTAGTVQSNAYHRVNNVTTRNDEYTASINALNGTSTGKHNHVVNITGQVLSETHSDNQSNISHNHKIIGWDAETLPVHKHVFFITFCGYS